jgi:hypothetical protein
MARYGFAFFDSGVRFDSPDSRGGTMRDLRKFLENPFDDRNISMAELLAFSTDHLQRMIANNSTGDFTARITATQSALGLVGDNFSDDETKLGLRKARKLAKENFLKTLPASIGRLALQVAAKYGEGSPEYVECLPQGRSVFSSSRDDMMESHIQTFINGVTAHQADLGAQIVTDATAVKTAWLAVYNASESSSGAKAATQESKRLARENLQLMLFLNLLKIAEVFARQPEMLDTYMQQSLLRNPVHTPEPPPPPPGP